MGEKGSKKKASQAEVDEAIRIYTGEAFQETFKDELDINRANRGPLGESATRTTPADLAGYNYNKALDGGAIADLYMEGVARKQFGDFAQFGGRRAVSVDSWVARRTHSAFNTLIANGFSIYDAAAVAGQPGIVERLPELKRTTDWIEINRLGAEIRQMSYADAKQRWESFDPATRVRLEEQGFSLEEVLAREVASVQPGFADGLFDTAGVGSILGDVGGTIFEGIDYVARDLVFQGVGDLIEEYDELSEQTVQRGWRATEYAFRNGEGMNPYTWVKAFNQVGDGESSFRPGTFEHLQAMADGDADVAELARMVASGEEVEDIIASYGIEQGTVEWTNAYRQLRNALQDPLIADMVRYASNQKMSPGRAASNLYVNAAMSTSRFFGGELSEEDTPGTQILSGVVDGVWRMYTDPTLVAGKGLKARRALRILDRDATGVDLLHGVQRELGNDFPAQVLKLDAKRSTDLLAKDLYDDDVLVPFFDIGDETNYYREMRRAISDGDVTEAGAKMVELLDHVLIADGAHIGRYLRNNPQMTPMVSAMQELVAKGAVVDHMTGAQQIYNSLLLNMLPHGIGDTRKVTGLIVPRLTRAGTFKAQGRAKWDAIVDWSNRDRTADAVGSMLDPDDLQDATIFLDEFTRRVKLDTNLPDRILDFGIMHGTLVQRGHSPRTASLALQRRLSFDLAVDGIEGEHTIESLARVALSQSVLNPPLVAKIESSLAALDGAVPGEDLVAAFRKVYDDYAELLDATGLDRYESLALISTQTFGDDVTRVRSMFHDVYDRYVKRNVDDTRIHHLEPFRENQGFVTPVKQAWYSATDSHKALDNVQPIEQFLDDVIGHIAKTGRLELSIDDARNLKLKYDPELVDDLIGEFDRIGEFTAVDVGGRFQAIARPDVYRQRVLDLTERSVRRQIERQLDEVQAIQDAKLSLTGNLWGTNSLSAQVARKALRPITRFGRKIPMAGYIDLHDAKGILEFQKFLDYGVLNHDSQILMQRYLRANGEAERRAVVYAAKRTLLEQTGILHNPLARDFVEHQLSEGGSLRWMTVDGMPMASALLPDVHSAGGISIPDLHTVMFNMERGRMMQAFSPIYGDLSPFLRRTNQVFKSVMVLAPRLILRAAGLDEGLSIVARNGIQKTAKLYTDSWAARLEAHRFSRADDFSRMANGLHLPEAPRVFKPGFLGPKATFKDHHERWALWEELQDLSNLPASKIDIDRVGELNRRLAKLGVKGPADIGDSQRYVSETRQILDDARQSGLLDEVAQYDPKHYEKFLEEADAEGLWDSMVPAVSNLGPHISEHAAILERSASRTLHWLRKATGSEVDEQTMKGAIIAQSDPATFRWMNEDIYNTNPYTDLDTIGAENTTQLAWERIGVLEMSGDLPEWQVPDGIADPLSFQRTHRMFAQNNASELYNPVAATIQAAVPLEERAATVALLEASLAVNTAGMVDGLAVADDVKQLIAGLGQTEQAFLKARLNFASLPDDIQGTVRQAINDTSGFQVSKLNALKSNMYERYANHSRFVFGKPMMDEDEFANFLDFMVQPGNKRRRASIALDDTDLRPQIPFSNMRELSRREPGLFFHGNRDPWFTPKGTDEFIGKSMTATGPGLYVSNNPVYSAEYASQVRSASDPGQNTIHRLRLNADESSDGILLGWNEYVGSHAPIGAAEHLDDEAMQILGDIADDLIADLDDRMIAAGYDPANWPATFVSSSVRGFLESGDRASWTFLASANSSVWLPGLPSSIVEDWLRDSLYPALRSKNVVGFLDHESDVYRTMTLGDMYKPGHQTQQINAVLFDADLVTKETPLDWSRLAESGELTYGDSRKAEQERWIRMLAGGGAGDITDEDVYTVWGRYLNTREGREALSRSDLVGPQNGRHGPVGADEVVLYVPRKLTPGSGDQANSIAQMLGSPNPNVAARHLDTISKGNPNAWELVEVRVPRSDLAGARFKPVPDDRSLMKSNWGDPMGRDAFELPPGDVDPTSEFYVVNESQIAAAGVTPHDPRLDPDLSVADLYDDWGGSVTFELENRIEQLVDDASVDGLDHLRAHLAADDRGFQLLKLTDENLEPEIFDEILAADPDLANDLLVTRGMRLDRGSLADIDDDYIMGTMLIHPELSSMAYRLLDRRGRISRPGWLDDLEAGGRQPHRGRSLRQTHRSYMEQALPVLRKQNTTADNVPIAELIAPARAGELKPTMVADMEQGFPQEMIRPPQHELTPVSDQKTSVDRVKDWLGRKQNGAFEFLGAGMAEMSRKPQFYKYWGEALHDARRARLENLSPEFSRLDPIVRDAFGERYDDMLLGLSTELGTSNSTGEVVRNLGKVRDDQLKEFAAWYGHDLKSKSDIDQFRTWATSELGFQTRERAAAMQATYRRMAMFIDDSRVRSQFSEIFDVIWPFTYATEQFVNRWINTAIHSPEMFQRMSLYYQGFYNSGIIYEDPTTGEHVYEIPYSGALTKGLAYLLDAIPGTGIDASLVPDTNFVGSVRGSFAGVDDYGRLSAGPVFTVPMAALRPLAPDTVASFEEAFVGEIGRGRDIPGALLPSSITRFRGMFNDDIDGSVAIAAMQYITANNPESIPTFSYTEDGQVISPDPKELERFYDDVKWVSRVIGLGRGLTGLFAPSSPEENFDPLGMSDEFHSYLDAGLPVEQAIAEFLADHPKMMPYTVSRSKVPSSAPLAHSIETLETLKANPEFYETFSLAGPWLLPNNGIDSGDRFERSTYAEMIALGYQEFKSGEEWYEAWKFSSAAAIYFPEQRFKEKLLEDAGSDTGRKDHIRAVWNEWRNDFFAKHPMFKTALESREASSRREAVRQDMRRALTSSYLPEGEQTEIIAELVVEWDRMQSVLRQTDKYDSDQRKEIRRMFYDWAVERTASNFMASTFFERNMLRDLDLPEVVD